MKQFCSLLLLFIGIAIPKLLVAQGTWLVKAPLPDSGRQFHSSFTANGKLYIIGGNVAGISTTFPTTDVWEYDPATNGWTSKTPMPFGPRANGTALTIGSRCFYGLGQVGLARMNDWWEYLPATNSWVARASLPDTGRSHCASFAVGGKGYIAAGGATGVSSGMTLSNDLWEYDPLTDTWTARAPVPTGGRHSATAFAVGGNGYVLGGSGLSSGTGFNDMWMYTPSTNSWTARATPPNSARYLSVAFAIDTTAYMGLGRWGTSFPGQNTDSLFFRYSPSANAWTPEAPAPSSLRYMAYTALGGKGYVMGGTDVHSITTPGTVPLPLLWEFTPAASNPPTPTCDTSTTLAVSSITTSGATLTWSAVTGATGYQWAVNTSATPPASGSATTAVSQPATGLMPNTVYRAWLRTVCPNNLFSAWKSRTFSTLPTSSSVEDAAALDGVVISPNPARDFLRIELPVAETIQVVNGLGQIALEKMLPNGVSELSLQTLPAGVYVVKSARRVWTVRVVKID